MLHKPTLVSQQGVYKETLHSFVTKRGRYTGCKKGTAEGGTRGIEIGGERAFRAVRSGGSWRRVGGLHQRHDRPKAGGSVGRVGVESYATRWKDKPSEPGSTLTSYASPPLALLPCNPCGLCLCRRVLPFKPMRTLLTAREAFTRMKHPVKILLSCGVKGFCHRTTLIEPIAAHHRKFSAFARTICHLHINSMLFRNNTQWDQRSWERFGFAGALLFRSLFGRRSRFCPFGRSICCPPWGGWKRWRDRRIGN